MGWKADLLPYVSETNNTGARGMSAEQVLRAAIAKVLFGYSYRDLAFHLADSECLRTFCLAGFGGRTFKKPALQENIKALSARTWERINRVLVGHAKAQGAEKGRKVRIDCTVVEANIHHPADSTLLWDAVLVLTRLHVAARNLGVSELRFQATGGAPNAACWASGTPKAKRPGRSYMPICSKWLGG